MGLNVIIQILELKLIKVNKAQAHHPLILLFKLLQIILQLNLEITNPGILRLLLDFHKLIIKVVIHIKFKFILDQFNQ